MGQKLDFGELEAPELTDEDRTALRRRIHALLREEAVTGHVVTRLSSGPDGADTAEIAPMRPGEDSGAATAMRQSRSVAMGTVSCSKNSRHPSPS